MQSNAPVENKMGVMPIPRLIINMSLPMILSMLVQGCTTWWTATSSPNSSRTR